MNYYAHSKNKQGDKHLLCNHLRSVSEIAGAYVSSWAKGKNEVVLAALLHDLGKYGDSFQRRLEGKESGLDHWSTGAVVALKQTRSLAAAFAIYGHHVGLPSFQDLKRIRNLSNFEDKHPQGLRLTDFDCERLMSRFMADRLVIKDIDNPIFTTPQLKLGDMLDQRRIFSALTDADFLDTESHFQGDHTGKVKRKPGPSLQAKKALKILRVKLARLGSNKSSIDPVLNVRQQLLDNCLNSAECNTGLFTLTAPTGSGKTLSMLAFALQHAVKHNLNRIIVVIPYLTIIDQTAAVYRSIFESEFGPHYILEHHSIAGMGSENTQSDAEELSERQRRLLAENWDAPIVITTNVQILESLFSNRPSICRKLHRLADSVILFDEVQTLPLHLAVPTLAALSHLAHQWHSSVIFSSATQPAFKHLDSSVKSYVETGWQPKEIVNKPQDLANQLRRVTYCWPEIDQRIEWQELAQQLNQRSQALCIVNLKKHARLLWETVTSDTNRLNTPVYHLSTNLCPAHRRAVLKQVRQLLKKTKPVILIATQCIEAGVDIDFPSVWRSIAPLDAIIQAAGRCNREGKLDNGELIVFIPKDMPYPPMAGYRQATAMTMNLLRAVGRKKFDPNDGRFVEDYYKELYDLGQPCHLVGNLKQAIQDVDFPEIAQQYRLIKQDSINIIVPYRKKGVLYSELKDEACKTGLNRQWIKKAQPLTVSLFRPKPEDSIWDALLSVNYFRAPQNSLTDWYIYLSEEDYHEHLGLVPSQQLHLWIA